MTSELGLWVIAALEIVAALGIAAFWLSWLREAHDEPWLPEGYESHERAFLLPDAVLALLLLSSAALLLGDVPLGRTLSLLAAGMLAFLGLLDAAYFWRHGLFARERGGLLNAAVVLGVLVLATVLFVAFA